MFQSVSFRLDNVAGSSYRATWHAPCCVLKRSGKLAGVNMLVGSEDSTGLQINKVSSVVVAGAGQQTAAGDQRGQSVFSVEKSNIFWSASTTEPQRS